MAQTSPQMRRSKYMTEYLTAARPPRPDYSDSDEDDEDPDLSDDDDVVSRGTVHQRQQTQPEPKKRVTTPSTSMDPWDDFDVRIVSSLFASFDDLDAHMPRVDGMGESGVGGGGSGVTRLRTRPQSARPAGKTRMVPTISRLSSNRLLVARQGGGVRSGVVFDVGGEEEGGSSKKIVVVDEKCRHVTATTMTAQAASTVAAAKIGEEGDGTMTSTVVAVENDAANQGKNHHRSSSHDNTGGGGAPPLRQSNARLATTPPRLPAHTSSSYVESSAARVAASRAVAERRPPSSMSSSSTEESLLYRQRNLTLPPSEETSSRIKASSRASSLFLEKNVIDARLRRFKNISNDDGAGRGGGGKSREDKSDRNRAGRSAVGGGGCINVSGDDGDDRAGDVGFLESCDTQEIFKGIERGGVEVGGGGGGAASAVLVRAGRRAGTFVQISGHGEI